MCPEGVSGQSHVWHQGKTQVCSNKAVAHQQDAVSSLKRQCIPAGLFGSKPCFRWGHSPPGCWIPSFSLLCLIPHPVQGEMMSASMEGEKKGHFSVSFLIDRTAFTVQRESNLVRLWRRTQCTDSDVTVPDSCSFISHTAERWKLRQVEKSSIELYQPQQQQQQPG